MYRGDVIPQEINETIQTVKAKNIARFVDWMPNNFKCGIFQCSKRFKEEELSNEPRSVCMIANSTAISEVFERIHQRFDKIYSKKAFLHWFLGEGMEESELIEAREQVLAIQNDYKEAFNEY